MVAKIVVQEFVNMANGFERGRKFLCFFRKDTIARQPILEVQICHRLRKRWTNAAKQNGYSAGFHVMQKMVKAFE